jgi:N-acetylglucosamine-6-phosphate deacetylase
MSAAGMPDGEYTLAGYKVQVLAGKASFGDVLAGSVLTLDKALTNFLAFTGAAVQDGLRLLTANPAKMTGFSQQTGSLRIGGPANLIAVDEAGKLVASIVNGNRALPLK